MSVYQPGTEVVPGYRLIRRLGGGSFGEVWEAEGQGVKVALKIISKLNGIYAIREWQSLQAVKDLRHSNLVTIFGVWLMDEGKRILTPQQVEELIPAEVAVTTTAEPAESPPGERSRRQPLSSATLRFEDDLPTDPGTDIPHDRSTTDAARSTAVPASASGSGSEGSKGSQAKWNKYKDSLPPLELITAMTLGEGTLMDRLKACQENGDKGIPRDELIQYMQEAASGLKYLNANQVQHCDIKPENLLMVGGSVQICDYGSALRGMYAADARTHQGYTEQYAAPEQLAGKRIKLHRSTDLYALAVSYYALRTGKYPWADLATTPIRVIKEQERFDFSALEGLTQHPFEVEVLATALRRDPSKRFKSVAEFVQELQNAVAQEKDAIQARRRRRFRRVMLACLAVLMLAGTAAGAVFQAEIAAFFQRETKAEVLARHMNKATIEEFRTGVELANEDSELIADPTGTARILNNGLTLLRAKSDPDTMLAAAIGIDKPYRQSSELRQAIADLHESAPAQKLAQALQQAQLPTALTEARTNENLLAWGLTPEIERRVFEQFLQSAKKEFIELEPPLEEDQLIIALRPWQSLADAFSQDAERLQTVTAELTELITQRLEDALEDLRVSVGAGQHNAAPVAFVRQAVATVDPRLQNTDLRAIGLSARLAEASLRLLSETNSSQQSTLREELEQLDVEGLSLAKPDTARWRVMRALVSEQADAGVLSPEFLEGLADYGEDLSSAWDGKRLLDAVVDRISRELPESPGPELIDALAKAQLSQQIDLQLAFNALRRPTNTKEDEALALTTADGFLAKVKARLPVAPDAEPTADVFAYQALAEWRAFRVDTLGWKTRLPLILSAFEGLASAQDARAEKWSPQFVTALQRTALSWNAQDVTAAIELVQNHPVATLALREVRLLKLMTDPQLSAADYASILPQEYQALRAARTGQYPAGAALLSDLVLDAIGLELALQPAIEKRLPASLSQELQNTLDRLDRALAQTASATLSPSDRMYGQFISDLARVASARPPDSPDALKWTVNSDDPWLSTVYRRWLACRSCWTLAKGLPTLPRGADLAVFMPRFASSLPWRQAAAAWGVPVLLSAELAVANRYGSKTPAWPDIERYAAKALAGNSLADANHRELLGHVLLVRAEALENAHGAKHVSVVHAFAEALRVACDPYGGQELLTDFAVYERALRPYRASIAERSFEKTVVPADVAVIAGSFGAVLERDSSRSLASKLELLRSLDKFYYEMRGAFQLAAEKEPQAEFRQRWRMGEILAVYEGAALERERNKDLTLQEAFSGLCRELGTVEQSIRDEDEAHFSRPAISGMITFYRVYPEEQFTENFAEYEAALNQLKTSLSELQRHPRTASPWCQSWKALLHEMASQICLEQSWGTPWGEEHKAKLQGAVLHATQALEVPEGQRSDPVRAHLATGFGYEDFALHLKCLSFYDIAQKRFEAATKIESFDAYRKSVIEAALLRLKFRRIRNDSTLDPALREEWSKTVVADMRSVIDIMRNYGYEAAARESEWTLAQMLSFIEPKDYRGVEDIYTELAQTKDPVRRARYLLRAAESALRQLKDDDRAEARAEDFMVQLREVESHLRKDEDFVLAARLKTKLAPAETDDDRLEFLEKLVADTEATPVTKYVRLWRLVGEQPCTLPANFSKRQAALQKCQSALKDAVALPPVERLNQELQVQTAIGSCYFQEGAHAAARRDTDATRSAYRNAKKAGFAAIKKGQALQKARGELRCCAAPPDTCDGEVIRGYDAALETKDIRIGLAKLKDYIRGDTSLSPAEQREELEEIQRLLKETLEILPTSHRDQAIINAHLRDIATLLLST